jgi:cytochrome c oxidase subunit 1
MGSRGMMRRYARYDPEFQIFHQFSTVGAYVLGAGVVLAYVVLLYAAKRGKPVAGNPFGAASLEWQSSSPPSFHNFDHKVVVNDPYDFATQEYDEALDSYVHRKFVIPSPKPATEPQPH